MAARLERLRSAALHGLGAAYRPASIHPLALHTRDIRPWEYHLPTYELKLAWYRHVYAPDRFEHCANNSGGLAELDGDTLQERRPPSRLPHRRLQDPRQGRDRRVSL